MGFGKPVSVLVIGNEILYGEQRDTHSFWVAKLLPRFGFSLKKIVTLPDELPVLVAAIRDESKASEYVFTFGGIGATPDDLTRQAVAQAFRRPLVRHPEALSLLKQFFGKEKNKDWRLLADLPKGATVLHYPNRAAYGFQCRNVFAFPGFPEFSHPLVRACLPKLSEDRAPVFAKQSLLLAVEESNLVSIMTQFEKKFPTVLLGSYPKIRENGCQVTLRARARERDLGPAMAWLKHALAKKRISFRTLDD